MTESNANQRLARTLQLQNAPSGGWIEAIWWVVLFFVCAHFAIFYSTDHKHLFPLANYVAGTADVPYQYRVLMAWLMRLLLKLPAPGNLLAHLPTPILATQYDFIFLLVSFVMLAGATIATRCSFHALTRNSAFSRWASLLVIFMAYFNLPLIYGLNYTYPYDLASLFFFCLGIYLVLVRRWFFFYPVFVLGIFNRETICFLTLFFCISEWFHFGSLSSRRKLLRLAPHVISQTILFLAVKFYLFHLYSHNMVDKDGSSLYILHLHSNLADMFKPWMWPLLLSNAGFLLPLVLFHFQMINDRRIQWACKLILPLWFLIMMVVGVIIEVRVFTEAISIEALAVGLIAFNWYRSRTAGLPFHDGRQVPETAAGSIY